MAARWAEISSDENEKERFETLSRSLKDAGFDNEVVFQKCSVEDDCGSVLKKAQEEFEQIRIGGLLAEKVPSFYEQLPSALLHLKAADAVVKEHGRWWPRNFLAEGLQRALIHDLKSMDLSGGVFVCGAQTLTRSIVAALARTGFTRFSIADLDIAHGQAFVEELKREYFSIVFEAVPRHMITQLPSTHSMAINTLVRGRDQGVLGELFYFNFLKPGGVWLDLPLARPPNEDLAGEARAVGAVVELGSRVIAHVDCLWAASSFGVEIDLEKHATALAEALAK